MTHRLLARAGGDRQPPVLAVAEQRDGLAVERDHRHGAAGIEIPDDALLPHLPEQRPGADQLRLQDRADAVHLLEGERQLLQPRPAPGEPADLELLELPHEATAPHRHPVVQEREPPRQVPRPGGGADDAVDLQLEPRLEPREIHDAAEPARRARCRRQDRGRGRPRPPSASNTWLGPAPGTPGSARPTVSVRRSSAP